MKILLLNFTGGIPLGLAYLSACVSDNPRREIRIVDCGEDSESHAQALEAVKAEKPDIVGATVYTYHVNDVLGFMRDIKQIKADIMTVVGGPHPTALPTETVADSNLDVVVCGEGEVTFKSLVERVEKRESYSDLDGIAYKLDGEPRVNRPRAFIRDLDTLPFPRWQDLPVETYRHPDYGHPRMNRRSFTHMLATRGCPYHCSFCGAADVWGRVLRKHSPERVVEEMRTLNRDYGVHSVRFADSTFTIDRSWLVELCRILQAADIDVAWEANARADTLDENLLIELKKAKCVSINIGVESGDENVLKLMRKNQTLAEVRSAFQLMKKVGMFSWAFFMIGCPGETKESIKKTIDFAVELDPDQVSVCAYAIPYPGTEFYDMALKETNISTIPWEDYHHSRKVIYIPEGLAKEDIEEGKRMFCEKLQPHKRHLGRMASFNCVG